MVKKTKADAELTRQHLLDTAELLFLERGVSRTSLQDIATAAGTTRGAIYWHFKDKADLFNAMMERVVLPMEQALQSAASTVGTDADTPLQHLVDTMLAALHATVHDPQTRRVFQIATHKVEYVEELQAVALRRQEIMRSVRQATEQAIALTLAQKGRTAGQTTSQPLPMPLPAAALGLHMLVDGLITNWLLDTLAFDLEEVGRQTLLNYVRGLGLD
jgi:TetR/AcrR family acrAB operon transcriptional repressor